jgi:transcription antitermination protein NusB
MSTQNPSLQKKSAARMAAVQCLYTLAVGDKKITPEKQVAALRAQLSGNTSEQKLQVGVPLEPNYKLLESILEGVEQWRGDIDERIKGALSKEWTMERMSPLMVAILQCAVFEMIFGKEIGAKVVIDEYSRLTRSFFTDTEVNFVHGALSTLAQSHERI